MMIITECVTAILLLIIVPYVIGTVVSDNVLSMTNLLKGYFVGWALFEVICLFFIIQEGKLSDVIICMAIVLVPIFCAGSLKTIKNFSNAKSKVLTLPKGEELLLLTIFIFLLCFQLYKAICYVYVDGDDAFYIATAQVANIADDMYLRDPYRGDFLEINYRYALAPFPMWLAVISRLTKLNVAIVAHAIISPLLIVITYIIYYEISKLLFAGKKDKQYLFLVFMSIFVIFSNVSTHMAETFMITRSRQGKAALANIIIPFLIYYFLCLMSKKDDKGSFEVSIKEFLLLISVSLSAALMSLFGNIIFVCMIFALFLYSIYRKCSISTVMKLALSGIPNMVIVGLYIIL